MSKSELIPNVVELIDDYDPTDRIVYTNIILSGGGIRSFHNMLERAHHVQTHGYPTSRIWLGDAIAVVSTTNPDTDTFGNFNRLHLVSSQVKFLREKFPKWDPLVFAIKPTEYLFGDIRLNTPNIEEYYIWQTLYFFSRCLSNDPLMTQEDLKSLYGKVRDDCLESMRTTKFILGKNERYEQLKHLFMGYSLDLAENGPNILPIRQGIIPRTFNDKYDTAVHLGRAIHKHGWNHVPDQIFSMYDRILAPIVLREFVNRGRLIHNHKDNQS